MFFIRCLHNFDKLLTTNKHMDSNIDKRITAEKSNPENNRKLLGRCTAHFQTAPNGLFDTFVKRWLPAR
jgi:hypothetical protein